MRFCGSDVQGAEVANVCSPSQDPEPEGVPEPAAVLPIPLKEVGSPKADGTPEKHVTPPAVAREGFLSTGRPVPPKPPPARRRVPPPSNASSTSEENCGDAITEQMAEELLARLDSKPMCASGHPLSRSGSPIAGWWCSSCRREFSGRKLLWGCRVCNYDICGSCLARIRGLAKPPKRAPDATAANIPHSLPVGNYDLSVSAFALPLCAPEDMLQNDATAAWRKPKGSVKSMQECVRRQTVVCVLTFNLKQLHLGLQDQNSSKQVVDA